jgi:glycosyltransferase involved in cell wall biosynthesis
VRIAFVQPGLRAGGAEKVINILAHHRAELGDRVFVVAYGGNAKESYFPYSAAVELLTPEDNSAEPHLSPARLAHRLVWLRRRLQAVQPDLIVSFLTKTNVLTVLASLGLGVPVIISERNNPERQQAHPVWRPASHMLARLATEIVMQTDVARDTLPQPLRERAVVIPNPSVYQTFDPRPVAQARRVVAVGRLERQKGFDLLLRSFAQVAPEEPAATLTIFGEGSERPRLESDVQSLGLRDRVRLPGQTAKPGAWVEEGDVFVLSSRFEGFPNVLVEAMGAGLPSIAFDCPWGPSTIMEQGKTGILVPPEDIGALANALKRVVRDEALRRDLAQSAPAAVARFRLPVVLAQWDAVMDRAAKARPGRRALPSHSGP